MQLRTWLYLKDIVKYGNKALEFKADLSVEEILNSEITYFAIERMLFIVGEAVNSAVLRDPEVANLLSNTTPIRRFRNLLAHGYFKVDREQVTSILFNDLEKLIAEAAAVPEPAEDDD